MAWEAAISFRLAVIWVFLALLWGSSFSAIRVGVEALTPIGLVLIRLVIAAVLLVFFLILRGAALGKILAHWRLCLFAGAFGNFLPFLLIGYGEQSVDGGVAALLMGLVPVITVATAPLVLADEHWSVRGFVAIILGIFGLGFVSLLGGEGAGGQGAYLPGILAIVLAACGYTATNLTMRRFAPNCPLVMSAGAALFAALLAALYVSLSGADIVKQDAQDEKLIVARFLAIYLGLFPTALGMLLYFFLLPRLGATRLAQINFLVPLFGVAFGAFFLGERPGWNSWLGGGLILLSIYLSFSRQSFGSGREIGEN